MMTSNARVTFSEAVDITGSAAAGAGLCRQRRKAAICTAATNTTTMECSYTVAENDSAPNGIAIAANKLTLNGGAITLNGTITTAVLDPQSRWLSTPGTRWTACGRPW